MSNSDNTTRIIKRIYSNRKTNNPLLVIYPDGKETWCQSVDVHGPSEQICKNGILTTTTEGHVVTHIALEKENRKVKYQEGMVSCGGLEWVSSYDDIDWGDVEVNTTYNGTSVE